VITSVSVAELSVLELTTVPRSKTTFWPATTGSSGGGVVPVAWQASEKPPGSDVVTSEVARPFE
jgi:hypothetical protein